MKRLVTALFALSVFPHLLLAQESSKRFAEYGELIITHLSSAPFPHPRRAAGHTYQKQLYPAEQHYNDSSVALFIPRGFQQTEAVDLVVYLHGWRNNIDTALGKYSLPQQIYESGKNAILVFPEGPRNAPDSYAGKLEDAGGLQRFVADVAAFLFKGAKIKTPSVGMVILSGHSGGYEGIAYALMRGGIPEKVREVYLFDALYSETEKFTYWINRYNGKFINIYTDSGGTKRDTEAMMEDFSGWGVPYRSVEEGAMTSSDLRNNRILFIHTNLEHDLVVAGRMQFREFLKSSCLTNR
jgi:hypothetical protein